MLCAFKHCRIRLYAGNHILSVLDDARIFRNLALQYGQHFCLPHFDTLIQFCLDLLGEVPGTLGQGFDEPEALKALEAKSLIAYVGVLIPKHFMAVYMNDYALAEKLAVKINAKNAEGKFVPFLMHNYFFLQAMTSATLSHNSNAHKRQATRLLTKLKGNAQSCPENYLHRVRLIEAELANLSSGCDDALALYDLSIALAGEQGVIQEQALACERAGHALIGDGKSDEAKKYFEQASSLFGQWGARVKVDQLERSIKALQG